MKINGIRALDYRAAGDSLELVLAAEALEAVTGGDWSLTRVQTDDGDDVEAFAGYALRSVTLDTGSGLYTAQLAREASGAAGAALKALSAGLAKQELALADVMGALAELASMVAGGEGVG